jgi:hypothetical protein
LRVLAAGGLLGRIGRNAARALDWRTMRPRDRLTLGLLVIVGLMLAAIEMGARKTGIPGPFDIRQNAFTEYAVCGATLFLLLSAETTGHAAAMALAIPLACAGAEAIAGGPIVAQGPLLAYASAFACVVVQAAWALAGDPARAQARIIMACRASLIWLPTMAGGPGMDLSAGINPTYDGYLLGFDDSLGIRVVVLVKRAVEFAPAIHMVVFFGYFGIVGGLGVSDAVRRPDRGPADLIVLFLATSVVGYGLYWLFPAGGPPGLPGDYYASLWPTKIGVTPGPTVVDLPGLPRNCMPSLHAVWAYLLLMTLDALGSRVAKIAFALFASLTILGALTWGGHWFVDIVVSLPFAVAAVAVAEPALDALALPRIAAVAGGAGMVAAWFVYLKSGVAVSAVLSWSTIIATILASLWLLGGLRSARRDRLAHIARA